MTSFVEVNANDAFRVLEVQTDVDGVYLKYEGVWWVLQTPTEVGFGWEKMLLLLIEHVTLSEQ